MSSSAEVFDTIVRGVPLREPSIKFGTACVIGGSVAGLLAARVLSDHARRVVIVERDDLGPGRDSGPGAPHRNQAHGLLRGGQVQIESLLPGFTDEARRRGAVWAEVHQQRVVLGDHRQRDEGREPVLSATRPFLEELIRERVLRLPGVTVIRGVVSGLEYHDDAVAGVRYRADGTESRLDSEFTVDASGRSGKLAEWLEAGGYHRPHLERVDLPVTYATALFRRDRPADGSSMLVGVKQLKPGDPRADGVSGALVQAVEDDRWLVVAMSYGESRPARSLEAFRAALGGLHDPFPEALDSPVAQEIQTYRLAGNRRRDFAGTRLPARLAAVGDAVASFNPIYGQGMTSAALHAACLRLFLGGESDLSRPAADFFAMEEVVVDAAWLMSAGNDEALRDAAAGRPVPADVQAQREAMALIRRATLVDPVVSATFQKVRYLLAHPAALSDPALLERAGAPLRSS
ncbi:FAD-dependent monooxygenase [Actinoplanes sp. NBRC 103695]|uniref:FAD-dependent oxidoreductase n=1 Tax=Actinoplanes sp. NBRC 103695 TaxID=3032202 RepID=UPI0024A35A53|nr:FAD-dependent monooxygenase [Actinoplanes sp. NBRC 103695]GLY93043.1 hydroxylase [Actinoplanes sp. NBRC 103695]